MKYLEDREVVPGPLHEKSTYTSMPIPGREHLAESEIDMNKDVSRELVYCERYKVKLMRGACAKRYESKVQYLRVKVALIECERCPIGESRFNRCLKDG